MSNPLVIAYHLIWTAYGWWLPNDPRGSGSHAIASDIIAQLGALHHGRNRVQPVGEIVRRFYAEARDALRHPLLTFDAAAHTVIGEAFASAIAERRYTCWSCAIMPDHVHLVIRKHRDSAEQMIEHLKEVSRLRLSTLAPWSVDHPVWAGGGGWKVFLDHPDEVERTNGYVERNPREIRMPPQRWPFVTEYDGWPLHEG